MMAIIGTAASMLIACMVVLVLHEVGIAVCPNRHTWTDSLYEWMLSVLGV